MVFVGEMGCGDADRWHSSQDMTGLPGSNMRAHLSGLEEVE